jgi:hypothetical protein
VDNYNAKSLMVPQNEINLSMTGLKHMTATNFRRELKLTRIPHRRCVMQSYQRWNEYSLCLESVESKYRKSQVASKYEYRPVVLEYESEYGIVVLKYQALGLESSNLPSQTVLASFFSPFKLSSGCQGA